MTERTRKQAFVIAALAVAGAVVLMAQFMPGRDDARPQPAEPAKARPAPGRPLVAGGGGGVGAAPALASPQAAARRFADAYLVYQAGLAERSTWRAFTDTAAAPVVARLRATEVARPPRGARTAIGRVGAVTVTARSGARVRVSVAVDVPGNPAGGAQALDLSLAEQGATGPGGARWMVTELA
jgi:hypothetical protein